MDNPVGDAGKASNSSGAPYRRLIAENMLPVLKV